MCDSLKLDVLSMDCEVPCSRSEYLTILNQAHEQNTIVHLPPGHRLREAYLNAEGSRLDECEVVSIVLPIRCGNGAEIFEFVEDPLDGMTVTIHETG